MKKEDIVLQIENIIARHLPYDGECREELQDFISKLTLE